MPVESLTLCKNFCFAKYGTKPGKTCLIPLYREGLPLAQWWRCPPSMKGFKPSRTSVSHGYQHSLVISLNKREHWVFMLLRSPQESQRGADVKRQNSDFCQIQSKTSTIFNGLNYLSLDFKAETDCWTSCLKVPWATTVQLITPKCACEPQQWSSTPPVPGPHNSKSVGGTMHLSLLIDSGLHFYLQGHKQCCVLCDKDTCSS